jgi:nitroreductase
MDAIEAILTRRSVRKYTDKAVSDETVRQLLQAAMSAPSAGNEQPWHFIVIRERKTLEQVPSFHPNSHMLKQAALAILVCEDPQVEVYQGRGPMDCAAATQNMLLAAHSLGLGAVWVGIYPVEERIAGMRKLLGIPSNVVPISLVSIGSPSERPKLEDRFKPERIHFERWMGDKGRVNKKEK